MSNGFDKNTYRTPRYLVNWIARRFGGVWVDGCANEHNAVFDVFIGEGSAWPDFLDFDEMEIELAHGALDIAFFVNPPYSNPKPFVER
ncbi:adenine methyltransferase, partial [Pasteurellaceae bacterium TAE3-ERU1]|nr:adenine methyltransferase [Pasteurellaceae bacterium TAE3-ERU1]